jgi:O-antigen/teichoic acid export membrane protein
MFNWLKNLIGNSGSLRRRTFIASNYSLGYSLINGLSEFLRTAVFSRILSPFDYGLMAIASLGVSFLESFSSLGIEVQIVKEKEDIEKKLGAYWTIKMLRGLLLAVLACILCYPLAKYYKQPEIIMTMQVLSLCFIMRGCSGFGVEMCQRKLDFKNIFFANSLGTILILIFSLVALYLMRDYWAIVAYQLFIAQSVLVISFLLYRWKPRFVFDKKVLKDCAIFGSSIVVINLLNYFFYNYDKGVLGKLANIETLGYYARGYFLAMLPATHIANTIAQAIFPALREAANEKERLKKAYYKLFMVLAACFVVVGGIMALFAKPLILIVYGSQWLAIIPVFRILVICGVIRAVSVVFAPIFFIFNKPWLITCSSIITALSMLSLALPLTKLYGSAGTGYAVVFSAVPAFLFSFAAVHILLNKR